MNTRNFSTSLFCVVLLGSTLHAAAVVRPEIAQHLRMATFYLSDGLSVPAKQQIDAAEAVPGQTAEEQHAVARARAGIAAAAAPNHSFDKGNPFLPSRATADPNAPAAYPR